MFQNIFPAYKTIEILGKTNLKNLSLIDFFLPLIYFLRLFPSNTKTILLRKISIMYSDKVLKFIKSKNNIRRNRKRFRYLQLLLIKYLLHLYFIDITLVIN